LAGVSRALRGCLHRSNNDFQRRFAPQAARRTGIAARFTLDLTGAGALRGCHLV
jgi:hypothetical protein